jgi:hypothetical protein
MDNYYTVQLVRQSVVSRDVAVVGDCGVSNLIPNAIGYILVIFFNDTHLQTPPQRCQIKDIVVFADFSAVDYHFVYGLPKELNTH